MPSFDTLRLNRRVTALEEKAHEPFDFTDLVKRLELLELSNRALGLKVQELSQVETLERDLRRARADVSEARRNNNELRVELEKTRKERDSMRRASCANAEAVAKMNACHELEQLRGENEDLDRECDALKEREAAYQARIRELEVRFDEVHTEFGAKLQSVTTELERERHEHTRFEKAYNERDATAQRLYKELDKERRTLLRIYKIATGNEDT